MQSFHNLIPRLSIVLHYYFKEFTGIKRKKNTFLILIGLGGIFLINPFAYETHSYLEYQSTYYIRTNKLKNRKTVIAIVKIYVDRILANIPKSGHLYIKMS